MKIVFICLITFLYTNSLFSMDEELNYDAGDWRAPLILQCLNYKKALPTRYVCCLFKLVHRYCNTETAKAEAAKTAKLDELIKHLQDEDWSAEDVYSFLFEIEPQPDEYGRLFLKCSRNILESQVKHESKWPECEICCEQWATIVLVDCGHMTMCKECIEGLCKPVCTQCRTNFSNSKTVNIKPRASFSCVVCKSAKPHLYSECNDLATCCDCNPELCPLCSKKASEKIKVFSS